MRFLRLCVRPPAVLAAENLFLRKQFALYQERIANPDARRTDPSCSGLARAVVRLATKPWPSCNQRRCSDGIGRRFGYSGGGSPAGRPSLPAELQALIRRMAHENRTWGQERIANELLLKLELRVSPRTVRKSLPKRLNHGRGRRATSQRWRTFVRNHAQAIVACDFCVVVTATFRLLYVFIVMEHATRRILHVNVRRTPRRLGRCSSCVRRCRLTTATAFSSMTGTVFSHETSINVYRTWDSGY